MFRRLGLINKNQRGFTMIELMIAIAITGLITTGIAMAISQVFTVNAGSSNHMVAVRQVQNAGYWISHDAQMAQDIDPDPVDDNPADEIIPVLTLAWAGWEYDYGSSDTCINTYAVRYTYDADSFELQRHERITTDRYNSNGQLVETTYNPSAEGWNTSLISQYITSIPTLSMTGNKLSLTITASVGDTTEERTYEITPRPDTQ